jgi:hypothetical protein
MLAPGVTSDLLGVTSDLVASTVPNCNLYD